MLTVLAAQAQTPHSQRTTSAVQQLGLSDTATEPVGAGRIRELWCRGKVGIDLRVDQDPSPRQPDLVAMSLRYERPQATRSFAQKGMGLVDYGVSLQHLPGTCTWNHGGLANIPPEPGIVYFDLPRDAQSWASAGARDTTIDAAVYFPDVPSLSRYLSDPERRWIFYVDDVTGLSISFRADERGSSLPPLTGQSEAGTLTPTGPVGAPVAPVGESSAAGESPESRRTSGSEDARSNRQVRLAKGVRDVTAVPGPDGVRLTFHTRRGADVRVQLSKKPPRWNGRSGQWGYPSDRGGLWLARIRRSFGSTAYEAVPRYPLEAGARYHYLITVREDDGSVAGQRTGAFTARVGP